MSMTSTAIFFNGDVEASEERRALFLIGRVHGVTGVQSEGLMQPG